jgi:hypothetical protein
MNTLLAICAIVTMIGGEIVPILVWAGVKPKSFHNIGVKKVAIIGAVAWLISVVCTIYVFKTCKPYEFTFHGLPEAEMETHAGETIANQKVVLDGKRCINCDFENVTFVYESKSNSVFRDNRVRGTWWYYTTNPAVFGTAAMLKGFGAFPANFPLYEDEQRRIPANVQPPHVVTMTAEPAR